MKSSDEQLELVARYLDGQATPNEISRLEALMLEDPQLRADFLRYARVDAALPGATGGLQKLVGIETRNDPTQRHFAWMALAAAAVLVVLLGVLGLIIMHDTPPEELSALEIEDKGVAVVARAVGTKWKGASLLPDDSVAPGRWDLLEGIVELEFYSGASVILEAPAVLEVHSQNAGTLHYGKLRAHVPVQAQGFTIRTREVELVDLGTEFAMEVTPETGTAVHVLDGKVELFAPGQRADKGNELTGGQGRLVAPNGTHSTIDANPERFVSREELAQRVRELRNFTYQRWHFASNQLRKDPRLLAYYNFRPVIGSERILPNLSQNPYRGLDGAIVGAEWKWGRWRDLKKSLDFKSASDRVIIEVPGSAASVTLAVWVRLDQLNRPYNMLLASQEWNRLGAVHWRIQKRGVLELQVHNGLSQQQYTSSAPLVMQTGDFHRWMSLVAVYDGERGVVSQYRNGALLGISRLKKVVPVTIDTAEIANWTGSGKGSRQIRSFNGRFGELMIFDEALSAKEISELHRTGDKYDLKNSDD
ncbi:MAG: LamG-like jellyroll fold domain-containing protein [Verrucomicrobiota bacterium]